MDINSDMPYVNNQHNITSNIKEKKTCKDIKRAIMLQFLKQLLLKAVIEIHRKFSQEAENL